MGGVRGVLVGGRRRVIVGFGIDGVIVSIIVVAVAGGVIVDGVVIVVEGVGVVVGVGLVPSMELIDGHGADE